MNIISTHNSTYVCIVLYLEPSGAVLSNLCLWGWQEASFETSCFCTLKWTTWLTQWTVKALKEESCHHINNYYTALIFPWYTRQRQDWLKMVQIPLKWMTNGMGWEMQTSTSPYVVKEEFNKNTDWPEYKRAPDHSSPWKQYFNKLLVCIFSSWCKDTRRVSKTYWCLPYKMGRVNIEWREQAKGNTSCAQKEIMKCQDVIPMVKWYKMGIVAISVPYEWSKELIKTTVGKHHVSEIHE